MDAIYKRIAKMQEKRNRDNAKYAKWHQEWEQKGAKYKAEWAQEDAEREKQRQQRTGGNPAQILQAARATWEESWCAVEAQKSSTSCPAWTVRTLPLPIVKTAAHTSLTSITKHDTRTFLFDSCTPDPKAQHTDARRLRACLRRYHPDRFLSSAAFTSITREEEREAVRALNLRISQILTDIVGERRAH